jgi:hypothetical protein
LALYFFKYFFLDSVASNEEKQRRKLTIEEVVGHLNSIIGGGFGTTNAACVNK